MDPQSNNYSEIADFGKDIQKQWEKEGAWHTIENTEKWDTIPNKAGIYKLTFTGKTVELPKGYILCARKIPNTKREQRELCQGILLSGTVLTVGKSRYLRRRIKQHFSRNDHVNRLGTHLNKLFNSSDFTNVSTNEDIFKILSEHSLLLSFYLIDQWWKRDLLEAYGRSISFSLFDLGFEH